MAYIWEGNTFWQGRCILYNDGTHVKERDVMLCDVANNEGNDLSVLVGCLKTGFLFLCFLKIIYVELVYIRKLMLLDFTSFGCIILHPVYLTLDNSRRTEFEQRGNIINSNLIDTKNLNTLIIVNWHKFDRLHVFN